MEKLEISTVTPVYAGVQHLEELILSLARLREHWDLEGCPLVLKESIFVADDVIDDSAKLLQRLQAKYEWLQVIYLSRNFGQHPATIAGILHTSGDWIVTLDEDLQHHPNQIEPLLVKVALTHCDIVYAKPSTGVHKDRFRNYSSKVYKYILASITKEKIDLFNSFRLIRGSIARATASVCSHETYFDVALLWFTQRVEQVDIPLKDNRVESGNASTYNLAKLLSHARRMIVTTRAKILRLGMVLGLTTVVISIGYALFIIIQKIVTPEVITIEGWASLLVSTLFFGGIIIALVGIVLEYVAVILLHIQGKPTFFVVDRSRDSILEKYFLQ